MRQVLEPLLTIEALQRECKLRKQFVQFWQTRRQAHGGDSLTQHQFRVGIARQKSTITSAWRRIGSTGKAEAAECSTRS